MTKRSPALNLAQIEHNGLKSQADLRVFSIYSVYNVPCSARFLALLLKNILDLVTNLNAIELQITLNDSFDRVTYCQSAK